jgi:hypothetical protein
VYVVLDLKLTIEKKNSGAHAYLGLVGLYELAQQSRQHTISQCPHCHESVCVSGFGIVKPVFTSPAVRDSEVEQGSPKMTGAAAETTPENLVEA